MQLPDIKSIKTKLLLFSAAQIIIPIIFIGVFSIILSFMTIRSQTMEHTEKTFSYVSNSINEYTESICNISYELLYSNPIFEAASFNTLTDSTAGEIHDAMRKTLISNNEIEAIGLTLGDSFFVSNLKNCNIYRPYTAGYQQLMKEIHGQSGTPYWYVRTANNNVTSLFLSRIVYNPYTNSEVGLLTFQISRDFLSALISQYNDSYAIISPGGHYVARTETFSLPSGIDLQELAAAPDGNFTQNGICVFHSTLPMYGWKIIRSLNSYELYYRSYHTIFYILLLCAFSGLLLAFFTKYINTSIFIPLHSLANTMRRWDENMQFKNAYSGSESEIGILYKRFEQMAARIKSLIDQNYKSRLLAQEAEFKMLRAQINPHFLFNTLEAINSLACLKDEDDISRMIVSLSSILNHSIGRDEMLISLRDELVYIDNYLYIMYTRFPNKFVYEKDIDAELLQCSIPPMIIQPLIENAVSHGIIPALHNCILKLSIHKNGDDIILCVTDDGIGITNNQLTFLNKAFSSDDFTVGKNIGLINVNKRLRLMFGSEYHLKIESIPNVRTSVTAKFKTSTEKFKEMESDS